jgi:hypothetical protein
MRADCTPEQEEEPMTASTGPIRPEDILPEGESTALVNGIPVRKGTAAAFFANLKILQSLPPESPEWGPLVQELRAGATTMSDLGLFDLFTFRSPELAQLLPGTTQRK